MKANDIEQTMSEYTDGDKVPTQYCHLYENATGKEWIYPLTDRESLNAKHHGRKMVRHLLKNDCYDITLMIPYSSFRTFSGDYTATIYTDEREPSGRVFWHSCEIFVTRREPKQTKHKIGRKEQK